MTDIELVIKVPEALYLKGFEDRFSEEEKRELIKAIGEGIPLPEGHGDLVDIEKLVDMFWDGNSMEITKYDLSVIEPIIERDDYWDEDEMQTESEEA